MVSCQTGEFTKCQICKMVNSLNVQFSKLVSEQNVQLTKRLVDEMTEHQKGSIKLAKLGWRPDLCPIKQIENAETSKLESPFSPDAGGGGRIRTVELGIVSRLLYDC